MTESFLDETDRRILRYLIRDARQPIAGLARKLGLSESAVRRRISGLVDCGVIRRFTVDVDYAKADNPITVLMGVNVGAMPGPKAAEALSGIDNIVEIYTVTGEFAETSHALKPLLNKSENKPSLKRPVPLWFFIRFVTVITRISSKSQSKWIRLRYTPLRVSALFPKGSQ